jgi:2-oxoglutarate ferredoxin oxidoreductase subunit delta
MTMSNRIQVDQECCKGCQLCIAVCPKEVYELSRVRNAKGYLVPAPVRPEDCVGCRLCEMTCPDMAITVTVCKKETEKDATRA